MHPEKPHLARARLRIAAPYLALLTIVLVSYIDPIVTGRTFFYRDLGMTMRPVLADARAEPVGHADGLPLWTHAISNGRPLLANPGYSLLAPLNVLYSFLPFDAAFNLFLVLHAAIAACGMAFLARRLGCSREAAFAAGAAYALGGGLVSALTLYWTVVAAAWAPFSIVAGVEAARAPTARGVARLALAIGLQAIGGQPEPIAATLLVGFVASFAWAGGPFRHRLLPVAGTWIAGVLGGLLLAAPQLLPAALHARTTLRALGFTAEGLLFNSLHPRRALWLVIPGLGGNPIDAREAGGFPGAALLDGSSPYLLSIYLGAVPVALAIAALVLARRSPATRALAFTLAGLAGLGVFVASGRFVPGASTLVEALPFPIPFRFAEKALYVTFLALPPLAALGLDALRSSRFPRFALLLAVAVALDLSLAHTGYAPTIDVADLAAPPLAHELTNRSRALGIPDGAWRVHHERQRASGGWSPPAGSLPPTEEDFYRWQVRMLVPPSGAPHGIRAAMELESDHLDDARYLAVTRAAYSDPREALPLALGEAGVLWVVSPQPDLDTATSGLLARELALGPDQGVPAGSGFVYRNTRFVPRARVTADFSAVPPPQPREFPEIARRRYDGDSAWPPAAIVEADDDPLFPVRRGGGEAGSVTAVTETHRGLVLTAVVDRPAILVVSDVPADIAAWGARVDGRRVPVWRANLAYLAVPVPSGRHEIRLDYRPPGIRAGVLVLVLALLGCAAAWTRIRGRSSLPGRATPSPGLAELPIATPLEARDAVYGIAPGAVFLAMVAYFLWASPYSLTDFPLDDAWIHRVYAQSIATGQGFAYNPGHQEAGSTSPLWAIVTAPAHWLSGFGVHAVTATVKILGIALGALTLFLVQRITSLLTGSAVIASIAAVVFLTDSRLVFSALSGMESSLLTALLVGGVYAMLTRRWKTASLCVGLSLVTRPEAALVLPFYVGLLVTYGKRHAEARTAFVWLSPFAPMVLWSAFCFAVNGHPLPNTFYLKAHPFRLGLAEIRTAWTILTQHGPSSTFLVVVGLGAFVAWAYRSRRGLGLFATLLFVLFPLGFAAAVAGSRSVDPEGYYWTRWIDPASLLLSVSVSIGVALLVGIAFDRRLSGQLPDGLRDTARAAYAITGVGILCVGLASPSLVRSIEDRRSHLGSDSRAIHRVNVAAGEWIDRSVPSDVTVGVNDAGAIRYFGKRRTVDLRGLNCADIAFGRIRPERAIADSDWLVVFPSWFEESSQLTSFEERARFSIRPEEYTVCDCPGQTSSVILERRQRDATR